MSKNRRARRSGLGAAAAIAAAVIVWAAQQAAAQAPRQLEAHEHGHGTLDMAIEGRTLEVGLEVPGADIVGFEHAAASDADRAAVAAAKKKLADPSLVFALPAQAGCKLVSADVALEGDAEPAAETQRDEDRGARHGEAAHSEFFVEYEFECANVTALAQITLSYFGSFPNARELEVTLVTEKGQKTFEVARDSPRIDIGDLL